MKANEKTERPFLKAINPYRYEMYEGEEVVIFTTRGKYMRDIIVDKRTWEEYLYQYSWTGNENGSSFSAKTSIKGTSISLRRIIFEREFPVLMTYGREVDYINRNELDNRVANIRSVTARFNGTNVTTTKQNVYFQQGRWKCHMNIDGKIYVEMFDTKQEALDYRNNVLMPIKKKKQKEMLKKERSIEFERGLMLKLEAGEKDEVLAILEKYGIETK